MPYWLLLMLKRRPLTQFQVVLAGVCLPQPLPHPLGQRPLPVSSHSETLPAEFLGGKPLCMNQYYQILSSCRVPGPKQDSVVNFLKTKKPPMHITVVHNYQVGTTALLRGHSPSQPKSSSSAAAKARRGCWVFST